MYLKYWPEKLSLDILKTKGQQYSNTGSYSVIICLWMLCNLKLQSIHKQIMTDLGPAVVRPCAFGRHFPRNEQKFHVTSRATVHFVHLVIYRVSDEIWRYRLPPWITRRNARGLFINVRNLCVRMLAYAWLTARCERALVSEVMWPQGTPTCRLCPGKGRKYFS